MVIISSITEIYRIAERCAHIWDPICVRSLLLFCVSLWWTWWWPLDWSKHVVYLTLLYVIKEYCCAEVLYFIHNLLLTWRAPSMQPRIPLMDWDRVNGEARKSIVLYPSTNPTVDIQVLPQNMTETGSRWVQQVSRNPAENPRNVGKCKFKSRNTGRSICHIK